MKDIRLIAFEGCDGAGKTTQARLLCERLEKDGVVIKRLKFPDYDSPSSGPVKLYLSGALGPGPINPYGASVLYAADRFCSFKGGWERDYESGSLIITDRYVTSNMIYMAARLPAAQREGYIKWLIELEYGAMGLPAPDMVLYLDLPPGVSETLIRSRAGGLDTDIHESDSNYQKNVGSVGKEFAKIFGWTVISCARQGVLLSAEEISDMIYRQVKNQVSKNGGGAK